jgi:hypothetical protein
MVKSSACAQIIYYDHASNFYELAKELQITLRQIHSIRCHFMAGERQIEESEKGRYLSLIGLERQGAFIALREFFLESSRSLYASESRHY